MAFAEFWDKELGFCHCGDPSSVIKDIRDFLNISSTFDDGGIPQYKRREERFGYAYGIMLGYLMDKYELTEHGGSINTVTLTEKGEAMLEELNGFKGEDLDDLLNENHF